MTTAPTLSRATFTTSRVLEFFTEKELQMQIGQGAPVWPLALVKELIDNGLDACENADTAPEITVAVAADAVTVKDNGPGLPEATLRRSLDYLVRVSDKSYYVSPTRGQLGNALKCVWAAPFVVSGERGRVEVATGGVRSTIDVTLDRIAQAPRLDVDTGPSDVTTGTEITLHWPQVASYLLQPPAPGFYTLVELLGSYAAFNPHATFTLQTPDGSTRWTATREAWEKWRPNQPTSPHWYSTERLAQLVAAYLGTDEGRARTVGAFVQEFNGLSGTAKRKAVTDSAGLTGATLADLARDDDIDRDAVGRLLAAMQTAARPVTPARLGVVGEGHLRRVLACSYHAAPESIRYSKVAGEEGGVPYVIETAFGIFDEAHQTQGVALAFGVNWSAALQPPGRQLLQMLAGARVDRHDPVALLVHLACPRLEYTDRGKTMLGVLS